MPTSDNAVRVATDVLGRPPRNAAEMREALRILHVRQQEERQREERERENSPGGAVVSDIRWDLGHVIEEQEPTAGEEGPNPWENLPEGGAEVIEVRWQR